VRAQPVRQRLGLPARQHVHRLVGLAVDQHSAVDLPAAQREVVHPEHPRRDGGVVGIGQRHQQPQQGRPAGRGLQLPGQPGAGPAGQGHRDLLQHPAQQRGTSSVPDRQARDLLGERPPVAASGIAEQSPHRQHDHHPSSAHRHVAEPSSVAAVQPVRGGAATGACHRPCPGAGHDLHTVGSLFDMFDLDAGQVRKEATETLLVTCSASSPTSDPPLVLFPSRNVGQIPTQAVTATRTGSAQD